MPLSAGTRLGSYEILASIGAGGMGEVYRARDTKLKRDVALKVLPEAFASDPERMARFQREAEVLAALNHPNIAAIYGLEANALVMELVEGNGLAGPLPIDTALNYARQMAEALEYAHERGVIHRDLKPANVKVTPEGVVKLLDFGLAKAIGDPLTPSDPENSPTLTLGATRVGVIMGTAAYMSPEQASGKTADRRADIWSFGAVLYEMLAGKKAFEGESVSDTLASVLKLDPDWDALPAATPASIRKLVRRCLTKDRKQRLQAIGEARIALDSPTAEETAPVTAPSRSRLGMGASIAAGILLIASGIVSFIHFRETAPAPQVLQYTIDPPAKTTIADFALSPDGRYLAMTATGERGTQLWVRALDSMQAQLLTGTEGGDYPFWSPDSRYIGFFAGDKLKKIAATGGPAQTLCDAPQPRGGTWNRENVIVFGSGLADPGLRRVSATGGVAVPVTKVNGGGIHRFPVFLPDSRRFLYLESRGTENGVHLGSLDTKPESQKGQRVIADEANPRYVPPAGGNPHGHVLFVRDGTLMAQRRLHDRASLEAGLSYRTSN